MSVVLTIALVAALGLFVVSVWLQAVMRVVEIIENQD